MPPRAKAPPPVVSDSTGVYVKVPPELAEFLQHVGPHIERGRTLLGDLLRIAGDLASEAEAAQKTARKLRPLPRARRK